MIVFVLVGFRIEKNVIIYTFYDYVINDKEACQLLRQNFSSETSIIIRTLNPTNYLQCGNQKEEREKKWIVLEALMQPEKSRAASAYMIIRFSGLLFNQKQRKKNNGDEDDYDDKAERQGKQIRLLDVFAETVDEQDAVQSKGSVIAILDGDYYIPQKNVESGLAYIAEYDKEVRFEHIGSLQYHAYCSTCCTIDSHTREYCKYFEKEYLGSLLL